MILMISLKIILKLPAFWHISVLHTLVSVAVTIQWQNFKIINFTLESPANLE